ncbi:ankyrin, partial [Setomelanomma holmii]
VKNTWHALEFVRSTCHARNDARQLWERTNDLYLLIAKIESSVSDYEGRTLDTDILSIVRNALRSSNRTLDELARRCSNLGDKEDLAMIYRLTRPIYFTLSEKSIRKYEQQFQTHIMSMQIAFMLLDRGEKQQISSKLTNLLNRIDTSTTTDTFATEPPRSPTAGEIQRIDSPMKEVSEANTTASLASQPPLVDEILDLGSPIHLLTSKEQEAWRELSEPGSSPTSQTRERKISGSSLALLEAAKTTSTQTLQRLLDNGVSANSTDDRGYTALHISVEHDNVPAAEVLLSYGASITACLPTTPLLLAVQLTRPKFIKTFLTSQPTANLNAVDASEWTLIHHAVNHTSPIALQTLLLAAKTHNLDLDLNASCDRSWTPLMHLAERAHVPNNLVMAKALLAHGADINAKDAVGFPALYYAVITGAPLTQRNKFVALLVEMRADVEMAMAKVPKRVAQRFWGLRTKETGRRDSGVGEKDNMGA